MRFNDHAGKNQNSRITTTCSILPSTYCRCLRTLEYMYRCKLVLSATYIHTYMEAPMKIKLVSFGERTGGVNEKTLLLYINIAH